MLEEPKRRGMKNLKLYRVCTQKENCYYTTVEGSGAKYLFEVDRSSDITDIVVPLKGSILYYDTGKWQFSYENYAVTAIVLHGARCRPATWAETELYCKTNGI